MHGTRVQILRNIESWIINPYSQQIFWLTGFAGTGKTAIAWTVCACAHADIFMVLGGSFFCSRSSGSVSQRDIRCVIPTLAQLLSRQSTEFGEALAGELDRDPDILHKQVGVQVQKLLYTPLLALKDSSVPILFVIDALDECGDQPSSGGNDGESHRIISEMIEALVAFSRSDVKLPVKFLITSRPETHIRDTPVSDVTFSNILRLHTVNKEQVTVDIRLYISTRLSSSPHLRAHFTPDDVDVLTRLCDGLFIVATTALQYTLGAGKDCAAMKFKTLLEYSRRGLSASAAAPLDRMYALILEDAATTDETATGGVHAMLQLLAALLAARVTLSVTALAKLLNRSKGDVRAGLSRLHAVVHIPDDDNEPGLRTLHASFGDYLFDRAPDNLRIAATLGDGVLARGCLHVMSQQLHFNVSQSCNSYEENPEAGPDIIPLSLEYACLQWVYHLRAMAIPSELDRDINLVFCPRLLFWLEVVSVLDQVWRAAALLAIGAATVCGIVHQRCYTTQTIPQISLPELSQFLRDANTFVTSSAEAIEKSTPHIYLSALPFAAKDSMVYKMFMPLCTGLVSVDTFGIDRHGGRLVMGLTGHDDAVESAAYFSDGRFVASASLDGTVRIWDARTGEEKISLLYSGNNRALSVACAPNGTNIAAGTLECEVCIWSPFAGQATSRRLFGHSGPVNYVTYSPDGTMLASASKDNTIRLWKAETYHQIAVLNGHTEDVFAVAFSPDGTMLASCSNDSSIRLWHVAAAESMTEPWRSEDKLFGTVSFSRDGYMLASGATNGDIVIWVVETGKRIATLRGHTDEIRCVQFSPDDYVLVSASCDNTLRLWILSQDLSEVSSIALSGHTHWVNSVSFSPDSNYIVSASGDRTIRIWDARIGPQVVQSLPAHREEVTSIAVSPCGGFIVSGSLDLSVCVWNAQTGGLQLPPLIGHTKSVQDVAISPNGRIIASASDDCTLRLWDAQTGETVGEPLQGHLESLNAVKFRPDSCWLVSGSGDKSVRIWDVTGQLAQVGPLLCAGAVYTVSYSPDGRIIAAGDTTGCIYLWYAETGRAVYAPLQVSDEAIHSIDFSPDGAHIVSGAEDGRIRVFEAGKGYQELLLNGDTVWVGSVTFSSDGRFICSGSDDNTVRLWDASAGTLIASLKGHTHYASSVTITLDGRSIVSGSRDETIRIWDIEAGRHLFSGEDTSSAVALDTATLEDGWLVGPSDELLLWVPADYRSYLPVIPCTMVIGKHRVSVSIGNSGWHCGKNWTSCWLGKEHSNVLNNL